MGWCGQDGAGVIGRHAMRDTRTTIVRHHDELVETERLHQADLVRRHLALAIGRLLRHRLIAVAIAAQVGRYDGKVLRKRVSNAMPYDVCLRMAMQQKQAGALSADATRDMNTVYRDPLFFIVCKQVDLPFK